MPFTLAQLAPLETDNFKLAYVVWNLIRDAPMLEQFPFENVTALRNIAVRARNLPNVAFRQINAGYAESTGQTEQVWETVYGLGGDIQFDRIFEHIKNTIVDPKKLARDMKLKAMAFTWKNYFINGDPGVDPLGFTGLRVRSAAMPARQTVRFAGVAAAALDPTATVAAARFFFDRLEEMHVRANGKNHNAWYMNEGMYLGIGRVARYVAASAGIWLDTTKDQFDRTIVTLHGSPMYDMGLQQDQTTEVISGTQTAGDGGADATDLFCVAHNLEQGIVGIQLNDLTPYDPLSGGEMEGRPSTLERIDWWTGLAGFGSYGFTRGVNVEDAANWT